jgi:hypothetical protein
VSIVVGLEVPGGIRRDWKALVLESDLDSGEEALEVCPPVERLELERWYPAMVEQGVVHLEVVGRLEG